MLIGIPKEQNDTRIAITPFVVDELLKLGFLICVEQNAGILSNFSDLLYKNVNAKIVDRKTAFFADIVLKVNAPSEDEIHLFKENSILISLINPNNVITELLRKKYINIISMNNICNILKNKSIDISNSMANITGYRAIIEAANQFERFFSNQFDIVGKLPSAKVIIIGASKTGIAAIKTAKNLGATVLVFDIRKEIKEQIESMGAEFLGSNIHNQIDVSCHSVKTISKEIIKSEINFITSMINNIDIIVTSAIFKKKYAPILITKEMVNLMKSGSIIVDLAIQYGGNCELTQLDKLIITDNNIKIIGYSNFTSRLSNQSSISYSISILNLIKLFCKEKNGKIDINFNDIIHDKTTFIKKNKIVYPFSSIKTIESKFLIEKHNVHKTKSNYLILKFSLLLFFICFFCLLINYSSEEFLLRFTIFVLSCVIGYHIVFNISYILYTPLIFITNAISGIIILCALTQIGNGGLITCLSFITILMLSISIFSSFTIVNRILKMFYKK